MRHGESQNNVLSKISNELYQEKRSAEPEISEKGLKECEEIGTWLNINKFKIDHIYTSAHKRALLSALHVRKAYQCEVPIELMLQIHERGGVYKGNDVFKGLSKEKVIELVPDIKIDQQAKITDEGWYALDHVETMPECMERAKEVIRIFKQLATEC